jgi:hypothetical protein
MTMLNRNLVLRALIKYFEEKGRVLTIQEYARETDTPVRVQSVKQVFGSWAKMETLMNRERPKNSLNTDAALAEINKPVYEAAEQWKRASENQDKKAEKEARAQVVAETLAANAATPEGANANKIAIGGKLPSEQQDFSAMGATVKVDPVNLEQTIVDVEPELVSTQSDGVMSGKTPMELRDAVAADAAVKAGDVPVDKSTAGGSTGEASIATVQALGDTDKKPVEDHKTVAPAKK